MDGSAGVIWVPRVMYAWSGRRDTAAGRARGRAAQRAAKCTSCCRSTTPAVRHRCWRNAACGAHAWAHGLRREAVVLALVMAWSKGAQQGRHAFVGGMHLCSAAGQNLQPRTCTCMYGSCLNRQAEVGGWWWWWRKGGRLLPASAGAACCIGWRGRCHTLGMRCRIAPHRGQPGDVAASTTSPSWLQNVGAGASARSPRRLRMRPTCQAIALQRTHPNATSHPAPAHWWPPTTNGREGGGETAERITAVHAQENGKAHHPHP